MSHRAPDTTPIPCCCTSPAHLLLGLGLQRFYVGKIGTGILYLITLGGLGIWFLIDLIMILIGSFKDKQDRVLSNW